MTDEGPKHGPQDILELLLNPHEPKADREFSVPEIFHLTDEEDRITGQAARIVLDGEEFLVRVTRKAKK